MYSFLICFLRVGYNVYVFPPLNEIIASESLFTKLINDSKIQKGQPQLLCIS